jgi:AcrR family transcriptional regulator
LSGSARAKPFCCGSRLFALKRSWLDAKISRHTAVDRLLLAALEEIAAVGVDAFAVTSVARRAGVARSSLYNHFEDSGDIFAELWVRYGETWLEGLATDPEFGSTRADQGKANFDTAMLELFAVAHRFSELHVLVRESSAHWWARLAADEPTKLKLLWSLGNRIGIELSRPVTPEIVEAYKTFGLLEHLENLREVPAIATQPASNSRQRKPADQLALVQDPFIEFENEDERLLLAAIKVIANHGVVNASIARIARRAGVTKGSVYPRFQDAKVIVSRGFALSLVRVVAANTQSLIEVGFTPETLTEVALNALTEERRVWRDFRTELHVAARRNPELAQEMAAAFELTRLALSSIAENYTRDSGEIYALTQSMQATSVGWPVLFANGIDLTKVNYPLLFAELARYVLSPAALAKP